MATLGEDDSPLQLFGNRDDQVKMREIIADSTVGPVGNRWEKCWQVGVNPWDVGGVTPMLQEIINEGKLPAGRALVPGCGTGYDVLGLATESRHVVGLDVSETIIEVAKQMAAQEPQGKWVEFLLADFFTYAPKAPFDLIFDYTFFCAIHPSLRPAWAVKTAELLASDGELITLIFPIHEYEGGPPFAVSVNEYEKLLNEQGLTMVSCKDNELAIGNRKGREKVAHWRRTGSKT